VMEEDEEQWREWIQVWYISYIVRTFVNATMYPHPAQYFFKKQYKRPGLYTLQNDNKI
jgi:hypothetical protein